jgi:5-methyltetrahydrofolate--homocysteine methyltransferase
MTMAAFLGGNVELREDTVWVSPSVDDWTEFEVSFEENYWVEMSARLLERQAELADGRYVVAMPDLGDALTVFSLLRGTERLLMDLVEQPALMKEKIRDFTAAWQEAHAYFWSIYRRDLPGDCSWLLWAPGKTYACQCDVSTMMSPAMFEEFVVPELGAYVDYLDWPAWHLDGPEEVKHLDALLAFEDIRVFQIVPAAGGAGPASEFWLEQMERIQSEGRRIYVGVPGPQEALTVLDRLEPEGVYLNCPTFRTAEETRAFVDKVGPPLSERYWPV